MIDYMWNSDQFVIILRRAEMPKHGIVGSDGKIRDGDILATIPYGAYIDAEDAAKIIDEIVLRLGDSGKVS